MYLDHYHLNAKPFNISPGPRFLWLGEKHKEALATLNYGIQEDLGFLLLTGDVGVGKTALIHRLINSLDSSTIVAHITDPGLGTDDFFKLLAVEFNIPVEFHGKGEFLIELEKFLYAAYSDHKKVLLVVDEAQRLNNKLLDQIRVLSNIELSDRKLINIFFVGQPEFKKTLMANSNRAIRQRIAINYQIQPLNESETGEYIEHRLKVAGATHNIFKPSAIREIFRFTDGYPRAINILCDHALLTGYASGLKSIDSGMIEECEHELNIRAGFDLNRTALQTSTKTTRPETRSPAPPRSTSMAYPILIGLLVVLGALAGYYYFLWPAPRWMPMSNTESKLADASNQQTVTIAEVPQRIPGKIQPEPAQVPSKDEIELAKPAKVNKTQAKAAPTKEKASVDRPPAIFTAQAKPAPKPLPYITEVDRAATSPGKTEKTSAVRPAPSGNEPEAQADADVPEKIEKRNVVVPEDEIATSDRPAELTIADTPTPDPLPERSAPDGELTAPGRSAAAAAAMLAVLSDTEPESPADPTTPDETGTQDTSPALEMERGADGQAAVAADADVPKPDPSTGTPAVNSVATQAGKATAGAAGIAVQAPAKPKSEANATPPKETLAQAESPSRKADTGAEGQVTVTGEKIAPTPAPSPAAPVAKSDAARPGKTEAGAAGATVLAAAKPSSPAKPEASVGQASTQSTTNALKSKATKSPPVIEPGSQASASPSTAVTERTDQKTNAGNPAPAQVNTPPVKSPAEIRSEPSLAAITETQRQPSSIPIGGAIPSGEKPDKNDLENRLRSFLQNYCNTYSAKNFDAFTNLFIPDARENGTPFIRLLPKYKRNFEFIETIEYRIELQQFSYDEDRGIVTIDGDFFLKWLPPDQKWRENAGKISMSLQEKGSSFLVQRLDYQGGRTAKK